MKNDNASASEALARSLLEFRKQGGRHHNPNELGRAEGHLLMFLNGLPDDDPGRKISDLAKELELTVSTLTQTTTSLVRLGYITRNADPNDRRVTRIALTPRGRSEVMRYLQEFTSYCSRIVDYLGEKESLVFAALLEKICLFMEAEPRQVREDLTAKDQ